VADYILAIDQGTSSSRAILFNREGELVHVAQEEFPQYFPNDGWVEHEPEEIWHSVKNTVEAVLARLEPNDTVAGIGITNQRETTVVWDRETGDPIHRAIVWQDRRTAGFCLQLKDQGLQDQVQAKTGLLIDPYFSATKVRWLLDNVTGARNAANEGHLAFGTIDTYILWKLTEGRAHRTDATNASRTMMFNIHDQVWDGDLLTMFDVPASILPEVCDSAADFGVCDASMFGIELPILSMIGDQQAALVGQTCFEQGMAKSTYGTGCFMIVNTGDHALKSENRLLTTIAYRLNGKTTYALEGSIFVAGAAVQWLRDGLKLLENAAESQALAESTPLNHGVYLVPAFTGLGAPYWDPDARGGLLGLTRDTGIKELVSAALQSVCYQTKDLLCAMEADGQELKSLRVDGGMVANDWVMQFLADILDTTVERPQIIETTALGAAYLAGLQAGIYGSLAELAQSWSCERKFTAALMETERQTLYQGWLEAVKRVMTN